MRTREARLARLEGGTLAPGRAILTAERDRLQAEIDRDYEGDPMTWPEPVVDRYLEEASAAGSDRFARLAELERALLTPKDRAAQQAIEAELATMSADEVDAILAEAKQ